MILNRKLLGTTRKANSIVGSVFTFYYKNKTGSIDRPIILSVRRKGQRKYVAKNGQSYMGGIRLNGHGISPYVIGYILKQTIGKKFLTYKQVQVISLLTGTMYRTYNTRKMREFAVVDEATYLEELEVEELDEDLK